MTETKGEESQEEEGGVLGPSESRSSIPPNSSHCALSPGRSACHIAATGFHASWTLVGFKLMGSAGRRLEGRSRVNWGVYSSGSFPPPQDLAPVG